MQFFAALIITLLLGNSCGEEFEWQIINDTAAICNDYTPAGYFVASGRTPEHWVIFLESGGGCYSPETCNARYFNQNVRTTFKYSDSPSIGPLTRYDIAKAKTSSTGKPLNEFVSPLVTSIVTFQNTTYFKNGRISVKGQTILDDDCTNNPIFCNHTRVIIPYCSSDLWLANSPSLDCNIPKDLYNQCYANDSSSCVAIGETYFKNCFLNSSNQLSFAFRGQAIYRGALEQLLDEGLADSSTVTLVGSSAGGVGVINHANWTLQLLQNWTQGSNLSVIADSSWFINFRDNVYKLFVGLSSSGNVRNGGVFNIITATDTTNVTCKDTTRGTPCCFSAFCMLSTPEYYPSRDVSTFLLFGLYDVYLLAESLIGLNITEVGQTSGLAVKFVQTISEYGGAMNDSLSVSSSSVGRLSYYVTQCFQHIYLVTSTLWGVGNLFGNQAVDIATSFAAYTESVDQTIWSSMKIGKNKTTIQDAISQWYPNRYSKVVTITDDCAGPHCNSMCPEQFVLAAPSKNTWPKSTKTALLVIAGGIGVLCILTKIIFMLWLWVIERWQHLYLTKLLSSDVDEKLKFPECEHDDIVSVSCLDLHYSVTVKAKKVKDEKKDKITPIVLGELNEPVMKGDDLEFGPGPSKYKRLISESVDKQRRTSVVDFVFNQSLPANEDKTHTTCFGTYTEKNILNGISIYFNPGELTGIMGPSGCGKTTFLDLLTGRRKTGSISGKVYVNGLPLEQIKDWYIANTGYILQLATPYYDELTVRENLTLAAQIKLPSKFSMKERFTRIEQVMAVSELLPFAETVVGKTTGPGLSGGQKRRLTIALQLLKLPSVLFLDEPTSGLDATSSYELLIHLNRLADSKRTVILTIHQPRLEIFHLFHRLLLLTDGKIAYHGCPERAYEHFVQALRTSYKAKGYVIPQLEDHNPADIIMDMLGNPERRAILTDYFYTSNEPQVIHKVIDDMAKKSKMKLMKKLSGDKSDTALNKEWRVRNSSFEYLSFAIFGAKKVTDKQGSLFNRLAALEARGAKRASFWQILYLPTIFFAYGWLLGTVYNQSHNPLLVMSGFCVYSVASALFMFPALYLYYQRALEVYAYEHADGAGNPWDIVIQGFIRGIAQGFFPVIMCAVILYLWLVNHNSYSFKVFGQVLLINLALNQTWVALLIFVICAFPKIAFRLSPIISSVAGFTSGFFVPRESMPVYYRWLFYINPNYYGFSASANILLNNFHTGCIGSVFECFPSSPEYYLKYFNFDDINPYLHIAILLSFTAFFLLLAVFSNWFRYTTAYYKINRFFFVLALLWKNNDTNGGAHDGHGIDYTDKSHVESDHSSEPKLTNIKHSFSDDRQISVASEDTVSDMPNEGLIIKNKSVQFPQDEECSPAMDEKLPSTLVRKSTFLEGGKHKVHIPMTKVILEDDGDDGDDGGGEEESEKPVARERKISIWERQKSLLFRVQAAREVLKDVDIEELSEQEEEVEEEEETLEKEVKENFKPRDLWKQATKAVATKAAVVSELKRKAEKAGFHDAVSNLILQQRSLNLKKGPGSKKESTIRNLSRQISGQLPATHRPCLVPIAKWKEIVRKATSLDMDENAEMSHNEGPPAMGKTNTQCEEKPLSLKQVVVHATVESEPSGTWPQPNTEGTHPHDKESKPDIEGTHPHDKGSKPNIEGTHPYDKGSKPNIEGTHPHDKGSKPNIEGTHHYDKGSKPNIEGTHPHDKESKPDIEGTHPHDKESQPIAEGTHLHDTGSQLNVEGSHLHNKGSAIETVNSRTPEACRRKLVKEANMDEVS